VLSITTETSIRIIPRKIIIAEAYPVRLNGGFIFTGAGKLGKSFIRNCSSVAVFDLKTRLIRASCSSDVKYPFAIMHKGDVYMGDAARQMLGLPSMHVKVGPGDHPDYTIFVQSTSMNRKLIQGTSLLVMR